LSAQSPLGDLNSPAPLWEPRHAAGDFDGDGVDELAIDFGASGAWMWNAGAWTQLSTNNPE